jgi:hypothetical protein
MHRLPASWGILLNAITARLCRAKAIRKDAVMAQYPCFNIEQTGSAEPGRRAVNPMVKSSQTVDNTASFPQNDPRAPVYTMAHRLLRSGEDFGPPERRQTMASLSQATTSLRRGSKAVSDRSSA